MDEGSRGTIEAVRKDGVKVLIFLKDMGQKVTTIGIRVGTLGSKSDAEKIHNEIASVAGI